jgi:hypothetical protein
MDLAVGPGCLAAAVKPTQPPEHYYFSPPGNALLGTLAILDIPLSAAADTATLPIALAAILKKSHDHGAKSQSGGDPALPPEGGASAGNSPSVQ